MLRTLNLSSKQQLQIDTVVSSHSVAFHDRRCPLKSLRILASIVLATTLFSLGCQSSRYSKPYGFGTIDSQKSRAADFDPYPLNDIGPAVVGGRPPGFFNPLPEPKRNELQAQQRNPWAGYSR